MRSIDKMLALIAGENVKVVLERAPHPLLAQLEIDLFDLALLDLLRSGSDAISGNGLIVIRMSAGGADRLSDLPTIELSMTVTGAAPIAATEEPDSGPGVRFMTARHFVSQCGGTMVIEASPADGMTVRLVFPGAASRNQ